MLRAACKRLNILVLGTLARARFQQKLIFGIFNRDSRQGCVKWALDWERVSQDLDAHSLRRFSP
jgi:hypothetical protein